MCLTAFWQGFISVSVAISVPVANPGFRLYIMLLPLCVPGFHWHIWHPFIFRIRCFLWGWQRAPAHWCRLSYAWDSFCGWERGRKKTSPRPKTLRMCDFCIKLYLDISRKIPTCPDFLPILPFGLCNLPFYTFCFAAYHLNIPVSASMPSCHPK